MPNRHATILLALAISAMLSTAFAATSAETPTVQPVAPQQAHQAMSGKRTWQNTVVLKLPFYTARIQVRSKFEAKGYKLQHEIPLGQRQDACLMLWEKDESKIIVMLRKTDVDRTVLSQGEFKDAK